MGFFGLRRSIRILPGLRINLSKSGASVGIGSRAMVGIPDTGKGWRAKCGGAVCLTLTVTFASPYASAVQTCPDDFAALLLSEKETAYVKRQFGELCRGET